MSHVSQKVHLLNQKINIALKLFVKIKRRIILPVNKISFTFSDCLCPTSKKIQSILTRASKAAGFRSLKLSSGGVHDACRMAKLCPMGMIFIPSVKGLSHTPEEFTHFGDMVKGAEVTAFALLELSKKSVEI